jgi:hypothetical protein
MRRRGCMLARLVLAASAAGALLGAATGAAGAPAAASAASTGESAESEPAAPLVLTASQRDAVGIRVEQPLPLRSAPQIEAFGTVLDPAFLVADVGRLESTRAAATAAGAEAARLERLYHDDSQASLRAWQAAQAQAVEAAGQANAAAASFRLQWGPVAGWNAARRQALLAALAAGTQALLRADVPGRHVSGAVGARALLDVDGVNVGAQVLGTLPRADAQSQSTGWLLEIGAAPAGVGPGARVAVRLQAPAVAGLVVPAAALVYAEDGAYVYRQLPAGASGAFHYESAAVKPLARVGDAWLVQGLTHGDLVVVQGAGVLWSLQGIAGFSAAEEEHD